MSEVGSQVRMHPAHPVRQVSRANRVKIRLDGDDVESCGTQKFSQRNCSGQHHRRYADETQKKGGAYRQSDWSVELWEGRSACHIHSGAEQEGKIEERRGGERGLTGQ